MSDNMDMNEGEYEAKYKKDMSDKSELKQICEYDLGSANGLFQFISDRVFKRENPEGIPNECWAALSGLFAKAKRGEEADKLIDQCREAIANNDRMWHDLLAQNRTVCDEDVRFQRQDNSDVISAIEKHRKGE